MPAVPGIAPLQLQCRPSPSVVFSRSSICVPCVDSCCFDCRPAMGSRTRAWHDIIDQISMRTIIFFLATSALVWSQPHNRGYYRSPAIHGQTIVFTAEGDLWQVGIEGGTARRLTSHPGSETL